jgi:prolipoprotein diacylglyceryl transferase
LPITWNPDPAIFEIAGRELRWYGLLFVSGFLVGFYIMQWMYKREGKNTKQLDRLLYYMFGGAVIGARLLHCLVYEPEYYLSSLSTVIEILFIWKGGLASHGGTLGMLLAVYLFQRRSEDSFLYITDRLSIPISLGAMSIRLGNFFNSEILGKPTDSMFGIIFSKVDSLPRHPAQLYEAAAYLFTFLLLLYLYKTRIKQLGEGFLIGVMFVSIFSFRFLIEFVKTEQADYTLSIPLNVGHLLSIPFIILGFLLVYISYRQKGKQ